MHQLAQDAAWRQTLIEKGRDQCRRFTWKRCAAETAQIYQDVLGH
jgi:glycosyltransferase involved in cell wall biosynthesis